MRAKTWIKILLALGCLAMNPFIWAQEELQDVMIDTEEIPDGIEEMETVSDDLISVNLVDVPVSDVVRYFARVAGVSIITGKDVDDKVTVNLMNVEWKPALSEVLRTAGLMLMERHTGIYTVTSFHEADSEPIDSGSIFLKYNTVANVLPVVKGLLVHTNASATAFSSANAIIVKETPTRLASIQAFVEKIDLPRPQVFIEAKFVELNDKAIEDLGVDWQVLEGYTVSAGSLVRNLTTTRRRLEQDTALSIGTETSGSTRGTSNNGTRDSTESLEDTILPDGTIVPGGGTRTEGSTGGSTSSRTTSSVDGYQTSFFRGKNYTAINEDVVTLAEAPYQFEDVRTAVLTAEDFGLTLSALKQMDGVEIVSNPKVVVGSGLTATIHVGVNEPNVVARPSGDNGDRFSYQLSSKNPFHKLGVSMEVTPTVNTESNITVKITPELSRKIEERVFGSGQTQVSFPVIQIRRIETEFNIESGRTVAIGGLTITDDVEEVKKVPLLGDIPIIGKYLFTHTHTQELQDEIIIFVTVTSAMAEGMTEEMGLPKRSELIYMQMMKESLEMKKFQDRLTKERAEFEKILEKQSLRPVDDAEDLSLEELPEFLLSDPTVIELPPLPGAPALRTSPPAPVVEEEEVDETLGEERVEDEVVDSSEDLDLDAPVGGM